MVTRPHGLKGNTRKKPRKRVRERGKVRISDILREYKVGDKVAIKVEPSYQKSMPHRRFFGKIGKIIEQRGKAYVIKIRVGNSYKKVICPPVHLKKV